MANHVLKLKATLDTREVQQQLNQLRAAQRQALGQGNQTGGNTGAQPNTNLNSLPNVLNRLVTTLQQLNSTLQRVGAAQGTHGASADSGAATLGAAAASSVAIGRVARRLPLDRTKRRMEYIRREQRREREREEVDRRDSLNFVVRGLAEKGIMAYPGDIEISSINESRKELLNKIIKRRGKSGLIPRRMEERLLHNPYSYMEGVKIQKNPFGNPYEKQIRAMEKQTDAMKDMTKSVNASAAALSFMFIGQAVVNTSMDVAQQKAQAYGDRQLQSRASIGGMAASMGLQGMTTGALLGGPLGALGGMAIGAVAGGLIGWWQDSQSRDVEEYLAIQKEQDRRLKEINKEKEKRKKYREFGEEYDTQRSMEFLSREMTSLKAHVMDKSFLRWLENVKKRRDQLAADIRKDENSLDKLVRELNDPNIDKYKRDHIADQLIPKLQKKLKEEKDRERILTQGIDQSEAIREDFLERQRGVTEWAEKEFREDRTNAVLRQDGSWNQAVDYFTLHNKEMQEYRQSIIATQRASESAKTEEDFKKVEELQKATMDKKSLAENSLLIAKHFGGKEIEKLQNLLANLIAPNMSQVTNLANTGRFINNANDEDRWQAQIDYLSEQTRLQREIKDKVKQFENYSTFS